MSARATFVLLAPLACSCGQRDDDAPEDTDTEDTDSPSPSGTTAETAGGATADTGDTADCPDGTYAGPTWVQYVSLTCTDSQANVEASLLGWSAPASPVIFMQETGTSIGGQWSEEHHLNVESRDECGFDEELLQQIGDLGVPLDEWESGRATVFTCDDHLNRSDVMTIAVYVEDVDSPSSDCLALGHDPQGLVDGDYDGDRVGVEPSFDLSRCIVGVPN
jgi:hypothetical protein